MKKMGILLFLLLLVACSEDKVNQAEPIAPPVESSVSDEAVDIGMDTEPVVEEETPIDPGYIRVAIDSLNVRQTFAMDAHVVGTVKKGFVVEPIEEVVAKDGEVWLAFRYEGKVSYIAKRFTTDNIRRYEVFKDNTLYGYYSLKDIQFDPDSYKLWLIKDTLNEFYKGTFEGEPVDIYVELLDNESPVEEDITLIAHNYYYYLKADTVKKMKIRNTDDFQILYLYRGDSYDHVLLLEPGPLTIGEDFILDEVNHLMIYVDDTTGSEVHVVDTQGILIDSISFQAPIESMKMVEGAIQVKLTESTFILKSIEGRWTPVLDPSKTVYEKYEGAYLPVYADLEGLEQHATYEFILDGEDIYHIYYADKEGRRFYTKEALKEDTFYPENARLVIYFGDEVYEREGIDYLIITIDQGWPILTYRDKGDTLPTHVLLKDSDQIIELGHFYDFNQEATYLYGAYTDFNYIKDIRVYNKMDMSLVYQLDQALLDRDPTDFSYPRWIQGRLSFTTYDYGQGSWQDLEDYQYEVERGFDSQLEEAFEFYKQEKRQVDLDHESEIEFYASIDGPSLGRALVKTRDLVFNNWISFEEEGVFLWYSMEGQGYCKRLIDQDESLLYRQETDLIIQTPSGDMYTYSQLGAYLELSNKRLNQALVIEGDGGMDQGRFTLLVDPLDKGMLTVAGDYILSPSSNFLLALEEPQLDPNQMIMIYDLREFERIGIFTREDFVGDRWTIDQVIWIQEDLILLQQVVNGETISDYLQFKDGQFTATDSID